MGCDPISTSSETHCRSLGTDEAVRNVPTERTECRSPARLGGLDLLRVMAMVLVVLFHILVVWGWSKWSHYGGLDLGQAGVSIFLAISGALAATSYRSPSEWFATRLSHVLPPYWIALVLSFSLTALFGYKNFGFSQLLLQFAGLGVLVPPASLVNVATWFISLLLLCHTIVFLARLTRYTMPIMCVLGISCMVLIYRGLYPLLADHILTFFVAFSIFRSNMLDKRKALFGAAVVFGLACPIDIRLAYTAVSLFLLALSMAIIISNRAITFLALISYEYYLLHGIFVVGAHQFFARWPVPAIFASCISTIAAAWLLQQLVIGLRRLYGQKSRVSLAPGASGRLG
jgi:peptidoglycan/LPS O-acetylase OafA/YrhL